MRLNWLYAVALFACNAIAAETENALQMPSARDYFQSAAYVQDCNAGLPGDTPSLRALRTQTLDYYRTKLAQAGGSDFTSSQAIRQLEANVVPASILSAIVAQRARMSVSDRAAWCRVNDAMTQQALVRNDLAMATAGWPGAKPLAQARAAAAALGVTSPYQARLVSAMPPSAASSATATAASGVPSGDASSDGAVITVTRSVPPAPGARREARFFPSPGCKPEYPPAAVRANVTGTTRLRFTLDAQARVQGVEITQSSGPTREHRLLDVSAKMSLATCRFTAALSDDGTPRPSTVEVTYTWALD